MACPLRRETSAWMVVVVVVVVVVPASGLLVAGVAAPGEPTMLRCGGDGGRGTGMTSFSRNLSHAVPADIFRDLASAFSAANFACFLRSRASCWCEKGKKWGRGDVGDGIEVT